MKFLKKTADSLIISEKLSYNGSAKDKKRLKELLLIEQKGFCAYSERFIKNIDSVHIEHFDGGLKNTDEDGYYNYNAVLAFMNLTKPKKIEPFKPILMPFDDDFNERIGFDENEYFVVAKDDIEAENLINYLGFNKYELAIDRESHIKRLRNVLEMVDNDIDEFVKFISKDKSNLSFPTAIENEFNIVLDSYLN